MDLDSAEFLCPYCGSNNTPDVDVSQGASQEWITDCEVCCRPIVVTLRLKDGRVDGISARKENE